MLIRRGTRLRIYPTDEQVTRLRAWENVLRFVWNLALDQTLSAHQRRCRVDRKYPTAFDQGLELTEVRTAYPWIADVPRHLCVSVLDALEKAWKRCWSSHGAVGAPRFKSKRRGDMAPMSEFSGAAFRVEGEGRSGAVVFPKIGRLAAVIHRPVVGRPKSCTLTREGDAWFASVLCEIEVPDPLPSTLPPVAIDRGVVNLLADSDGRVVPNPAHADALAARIARAQREAARCVRGSKNAAKAHARVAALQRKARRQRTHALHVESARYAARYGAVVLESLAIRSMTRSAKGTVDEPGSQVAAKAGLNRSILGAGWGIFATQLAYKCAVRGGRVALVPAAYSSQTCAACGHVDADSRATQADFRCTACGHQDHADLNAAKVLLERGVAAMRAEDAPPAPAPARSFSRRRKAAPSPESAAAAA